jgi:hypothetical protein
MTSTVKAWQCIGCGKIEAPQTCIGVCQDRKVEFVYAHEHAAALAALGAQRERCEALLRRLAFTTPRAGTAERALAAFRAEARDLLDRMRDSMAPSAPVKS